MASLILFKRTASMRIPCRGALSSRRLYRVSSTPEFESTSLDPTTTAPTPPPASQKKPVADLITKDTSADWSKSYAGLSEQAFDREAATILMAPLDPKDIDMKPDGLVYLAPREYRRRLDAAFGPGEWGLAPRSAVTVNPRTVSREYALICKGRFVAVARGEQAYSSPEELPEATEACKINALMRCSKDLGIASELWDPRFGREFKSKYCVDVFVDDKKSGKKRKVWRRKDSPKFTGDLVET